MRTVQGPERGSGGSAGGYYNGRVRDRGSRRWGNGIDGNRLCAFVQSRCRTEHECELLGRVIFEPICNRNEGLVKRNELVVDQGTWS